MSSRDLSSRKRPLSEERQQSIPVSLGKPSLRLRLEAYYKLIAPDQIANQTEWRARLDQIYEKFGGSHQGEAKLATKLYKKYGTAVQLQLAKDAEMPKRTVESTPRSSDQYEESWFELRDNERNSLNVDFTSPDFDPLHALCVRTKLVQDANAFVSDCPLLERVDQFARYLPPADPLYQPVATVARKSTTAPKEPKTKPPSCFAALASLHEKGPLSVLFQAFQTRQRVRVLVRYANGIRGTVTGSLLAFDKHMNLILRNVQEVYSLPHTLGDDASNIEIELFRRQHPGRKRIMKQILVRGDSVVLVYNADHEKSAWPGEKVTTKYRKITTKQNVPPQERVGTPGSLNVGRSRRKRDYASSH